MKLSLLAFSTAILFTINNSFAQVKWEGKAGDGQWATASNWEGDVVPGPADNVLLDNTHVGGSYIVYLTSGTITVSLSSLIITPMAGNNITLVLPSSNDANPGLNITGPGDALVLNEGAILKNSTNVPAGGVGIIIKNKFRINNGGRYIHNNARGNAGVVSQLSTAPGTELGIFEFDVPSSLSYTISASTHTFGVLMLSAVASNGKSNYAILNGNNPMIIQGDLIINPGVTLRNSASVDIVVKGNFIQYPNSTIYLSTNTNSATLILHRDVFCQGTITESGTGSPSIRLSGTTSQKINITGSITGNHLDFELNNPAGATLFSNLSLPYRYNISRGNLTLDNYSFTTPSIYQSPSAPVKTNHIITNGKGHLIIPGIGSSKVSFPVGIDAESVNMIEIENGGGLTYSVKVEEGIKPTDIALPLIAVNRTWSIYSSETPASPVNISFYYSDGEGNKNFDYNAAAEVGRYILPVWNVVQNKIPQDFYNSFYSVAAELNSVNSHFVVGNLHAILSNETSVFCKAVIQGNGALISWNVLSTENIDKFEIERAFEQSAFNPVVSVLVVNERKEYSNIVHDLKAGVNLFRVKAVFGNGKETYSNIIRLVNEKKCFKIQSVSPNPVNGLAKLLINSERLHQASFTMYDVQGKILKQWQCQLRPGPNFQLINVEYLRSGIYFIYLVDEKNSTDITRFIKQ